MHYFCKDNPAFFHLNSGILRLFPRYEAVQNLAFMLVCDDCYAVAGMTD